MSTATHCQRCGVELPPPKASDHRRKWCSERCRKAQYRGTCVDCGEPTSYGTGNPLERCSRCNEKRLVARNKETSAALRRRLEKMWADGMTARQIGDALGWKTKRPGTAISVLRGRGYNLPYRRTPEQIARITADSDENLRRARAARKQRAAA